MVVPVLLVLVATGVICVAYGVFIERRRFRLVRRRLAILPAGGPGTLTILHLSDLHFVRRDRAKARFLASLPQADIAVVTGDFLAEPEAVETVVDAVLPTRGRLASWFVLGSNDHFEPRPLNYLAYFRRRRRIRPVTKGRPEDLIAGLEAGGWRDLTNHHEQVEVGGLKIELLGLDDAHIGWQDLRTVPRTSPERFGLAVMHSPDSAPETASLGYDLLMAGHTHGGQVCLPLVGALVTNCSMPRRLVKGVIRMGTSILHISGGVGTSRFAPFRFWCRPEATFLELRPGVSSSAESSG
jgi:predicted MPP superfamily phosphohydrolase